MIDLSSAENDNFRIIRRYFIIALLTAFQWELSSAFSRFSASFVANISYFESVAKRDSKTRYSELRKHIEIAQKLVSTDFFNTTF